MNTRVREQYNTSAAVAGGRSWSCNAWKLLSKTRAGVLAAVEDLRDEDSNCRRDRVLGRRGGAQACWSVQCTSCASRSPGPRVTAISAACGCGCIAARYMLGWRFSVGFSGDLRSECAICLSSTGSIRASQWKFRFYPSEARDVEFEKSSYVFLNAVSSRNARFFRNGDHHEAF